MYDISCPVLCGAYLKQLSETLVGELSCFLIISLLQNIDF